MPHQSEFVPEFPGQRGDERVVMILYKHIYTVLLPILKGVAIVLLSFWVPIGLHFIGTIFSYAVSATAFYLWVVFWFLYIFYAYFSWYRDRFIVTDHRIIEIDQQGFFKRKVSELELEKVQNITYTVAGFFPTLFNFGTVVVQSAGNNDLTLDYIADPASRQQEIAQLVKEAAADSPLTAKELIDFVKDQKQ
ncbi:MAG: PH domain-containing protein [bacterium]